MNTMHDVETGVRRALKDYKVASGMSEAQAAAWADANLSAGVGVFKAAAAPHRRDPDAILEVGFSALKAWAQS
jgi:hypothetical protein